MSEVAQEMQRKENLGEKAELTLLSMSIPSQDLTPRCVLERLLTKYTAHSRFHILLPRPEPALQQYPRYICQSGRGQSVSL